MQASFVLQRRALTCVFYCLLRVVTVTRLIRVSYGDYQLQTIPRGMAIEVPVKALKDQMRKGPLFAPRNKKRDGAAAGTTTTRKDQQASPVRWIRNV